MKEKVCVVMPLYRNKDTLPRALESIFSQDYEGDIEVLLMFDDPHDGTKEVALECAKRHQGKVRLIEEGAPFYLGGARAKAIPYIDGDYVYSLDADDELLPGALSLLAKALRDTGADMVNASYVEVKGEKRRPYFFAKDATYTGESAVGALLQDASFRSFLWAKLFKRELLDSRPLAILQGKGVMFEDLSFVASLLLGAKKVVSIAKPVVAYHLDVATSSSTEERKDRTLRHLAAFALTRLVLEKANRPKVLRAFFAHKLRTYLSYRYDVSRDRKAGASQDYFAQMKTLFGRLYQKGALDVKGTLLEPLLEGAFIS